MALFLLVAAKVMEDVMALKQLPGCSFFLGDELGPLGSFPACPSGIIISRLQHFCIELEGNSDFEAFVINHTLNNELGAA